MNKLNLLLLCVCGMWLCIANEVAHDQDDIIVAQIQIPSEQMPAQKAVFVGMDKLEPQLVRTALATLTARGQKVSALAALDALVKARELYISKGWWATLGCVVLLAYAYSEIFLWDMHRRYGQHHEDDVGKVLWGVGLGLSGLTLIFWHDKDLVVVDIVDKLLDAHLALDFGDDVHTFIKRALELELRALGETAFKRKLPDLTEKVAFAGLVPRLMLTSERNVKLAEIQTEAEARIEQFKLQPYIKPNTEHFA